MSKRRITASELLTLADTITKLSAESGHVSQYGAVTEKLNSALVYVLEAAKSVAYQDARDAHNRSAPGPVIAKSVSYATGSMQVTEYELSPEAKAALSGVTADMLDAATPNGGADGR